MKPHLTTTTDDKCRDLNFVSESDFECWYLSSVHLSSDPTLSKGEGERVWLVGLYIFSDVGNWNNFVLVEIILTFQVTILTSIRNLLYASEISNYNNKSRYLICVNLYNFCTTCSKNIFSKPYRLIQLSEQAHKNNFLCACC